MSDPYALAEKTFPNGRRAEVIPLTFGRARICLINADCQLTYENGW